MCRTLVRCRWPNLDGNALYERYHDEEWGVPERDSRKLWMKLMLDIFEGGLNWLCILQKRSALSSAFADFDPDVISKFGDADVQRMLANPGIVRNARKIRAVIHNARKYVEMRDAGIDFSTFVWGFVGGQPIQNAWPTYDDAPTETDESKRLSAALKNKGFSYCGPTTVYAFMQSMGLVNDHSVDCFRWRELRGAGASGS